MTTPSHSTSWARCSHFAHTCLRVIQHQTAVMRCRWKTSRLTETDIGSAA